MRREIRVLAVTLMAFMLIASVLIKFIQYQSNATASTLSLREAAPPSGEVMFRVEGSPYARYLRSAVGIDYDGRDWELQKIEEVRESLRQSRREDDVFGADAEYLSRSYRDFNRDILNELDVLDDARSLELPEDVTDRVRDLSRRITEGMPTPFERAKAIETFLQVKYDYDLNYPPSPRGWEPNDWFLFESKEGICGNFNSAFVVLCRASGIPARLATGYYLLPGNEDEQPVYASQAHAWAEVGFEELGWLAFEAVPP